MARQLENPFYYLNNFEFVLNWVDQRYPDVLTSDEIHFVQQYRDLPLESRALLTRMVMRRGTLFRHSKLRYTEIGCTYTALQPLSAVGWVDIDPALGLDQLFALFTKAELVQMFRHEGITPAMSKAAMLEHLSGARVSVRDCGAAVPCETGIDRPDDVLLPLREWWPDSTDNIYELRIMPLCDRIRLMFFGNLRQDWSEFVLADLGLHQYETVAFTPSCRGVESSLDVDIYMHLHACSERLLAGAQPQAVLADVSVHPYSNPWLERRRSKLLYRLGQALERTQQWQDALTSYGSSIHPEARVRRIRVMERAEQYAEALVCAENALAEPVNDAEAQYLSRILPRLQRKLGLQVQASPAFIPDSFQLHLEVNSPVGVEEAVRQALQRDDTPVRYVENLLVNGLFGLLCWDSIFAPLPGAFFHPFQRGPVDLYTPEFVVRRKHLLDARLEELDSGEYGQTILQNFKAKYGLQCAFVHWPALDEELLHMALKCIPAGHLKSIFQRLLCDIPGNRSGLPDLIRFLPAEERYQMIEVKGPGDRLQDNQRRWLAYFHEHGIPASVCFVGWKDTP